MRLYLKFNSIFLTATLVSVMTIAAFNAVVDPYSTVKSPKIAGFNALKPKQDTNVRLFKAIDITRIKPKTIFLGTSRTEIGLDPAHPALANYQPAYNLGLPAANMYEARRYFEHALKNQKDLKTVIIGLDFFMFNAFNYNKSDFREGRLGQRGLSLKDALATKFSLNAVDSSIETILSNRKGEGSDYYANGRREKFNDVGVSRLDKFKKSLSTSISQPELDRSFKLSQQYLSDLKQVVELCRQRGIDLKLFISPSHATQWEVIYVNNNWTTFETWKRELAKIAPVWDFSGFNQITTEPINDGMQNYWDSSHYQKRVGDLILDRLFHYKPQRVPADFGVLLTPDTVEAEIAQTRTQRLAWEKRYPDLVALIQALKQRPQASADE